MKNDLIEEQNIDFGKTFLFGNVLNLVRIPQGINFVKMLLIRNKSKNNLVEEQNIDFNEIFLFKNVLNLVKILQGINSVGVLSIKSEFQDKCSGFVLDSIDCN